jgi:hypothetical protein
MHEQQACKSLVMLDFGVGPPAWLGWTFLEGAKMEEPGTTAVGTGSTVPVTVGTAGVRIVPAAEIFERAGPVAGCGQAAAAAAAATAAPV